MAAWEPVLLSALSSFLAARHFDTFLYVCIVPNVAA